MQPILIITAPAPGMIRLNGRFAGEASTERPLVAPIAPSGAVWLEYQPLNGAGVTLAWRVVFSGGTPLPESVSAADGLALVRWPGGAVEIEIAPPPGPPEFFYIENRPCMLRDGRLALGALEIALPDGAERPRLIRQNGRGLLIGEIEGGGQYLAALSEDMDQLEGTLEAEWIDLSGGAVNALMSLHDLVGHGRLEQWTFGEGGLRLASSEPVWAYGAPRWPRSPEETLRAAAEAALAGMSAEAAGYLSPALPLAALEEAVAGCDACAEAAFAPPGDAPQTALLTVENDHCVTAKLLRGELSRTGGTQGEWRVEGIDKRQ